MGGCAWVGGCGCDPRVQLIVCGSYRRGKAASGDVDCLLTVRDCSNDLAAVDVVMKLVERMHTKHGQCIKNLTLPSGNDKRKDHPGCCTWMGTHMHSVVCVCM